MGKQLAFYFQQNYCVGCSTCQVACKDKNNLSVGQNFRKVYEISGGNFIQRGKAIIPNIYAFWITVSCNHCFNPTCVKSCPTGALRKREEDGIVYIEKEKCIGCKSCIKACPYEAPQYNPEEKKVNKCDFCMDLLEQGKDPTCVSSCPMRALSFGTFEELREKYGEVAETEGMPKASIAEPALVITPCKRIDSDQREDSKR
ncbi:MAG: DMSO/selenate family reductase complex B subunit [Clostridium sp.]|uniref:DMSO/selenate family reductase complex B subunit n=1 Tax=Clostridium sp. TaxID=1506 RepID=UPI0039EACECB